MTTLPPMAGDCHGDRGVSTHERVRGESCPWRDLNPLPSGSEPEMQIQLHLKGQTWDRSESDARIRDVTTALCR